MTTLHFQDPSLFKANPGENEPYITDVIDPTSEK
jgi:hypothetical protein